MTETVANKELQQARDAGEIGRRPARGDAAHAISEIQKCVDERAWGGVRVLLSWRRKMILANAGDAGAAFLAGADKTMAEERERDPNAHWARLLPAGVIWSNVPLQS